MAFELKIVKAMYQRPKDIIFFGKIGRNLKVDIDEHGHQDPIFMLTSWVIEANQKKYQTIINMRSSTSVKKLPQLSRRIVALSSFISFACDKSIPFSQHWKSLISFNGRKIVRGDFLRIKRKFLTTSIATFEEIM